MSKDAPLESTQDRLAALEAQLRALLVVIAEREATVEQLRSHLVEKDRLIEELRRRIASLEKDSSNSSKPPSSDITKPDKPTGRKPRRGKPGGSDCFRQRQPFTPEEVDRVEHHDAPRDPARFEQLDEPSVFQQVVFDQPRRQILIVEHRFTRYRHRNSGRVFTTPRPGALRGPIHGGLFDASMKACVAATRVELGGSFRALQRHLRDVWNLRVSTGYLKKAVFAVTPALDPAYEEIREAVVASPVVFVDETGHKENGQRLWGWVFGCDMATLFHLAVTRSHKEILAVLGPDYAGVIHCDCFSAYHCYQGKAPASCRQHCLAHLIRDVRAVEKSPDEDAKWWSKTAAELFRRLFRAYHRGWIKAARRARDGLLRICEVWTSAIPDAQTLRDRILKERESFFRFLEAPPAEGVVVEPTNNRAERALRPLVMFRRITQGTRCEAGRRWWERMWSVKQTLGQQGRSLFGYLVETMRATAAGLTPPSVLAATA